MPLIIIFLIVMAIIAIVKSFLTMLYGTIQIWLPAVIVIFLIYYLRYEIIDYFYFKRKNKILLLIMAVIPFYGVYLILTNLLTMHHYIKLEVDRETPTVSWVFDTNRAYYVKATNGFHKISCNGNKINFDNAKVLVLNFRKKTSCYFEPVIKPRLFSLFDYSANVYLNSINKNEINNYRSDTDYYYE